MIYAEVGDLIKKYDNYIVITDGDPDGICSGILMKIILKKLGKRFNIYVRKNRRLDNFKKVIDKFKKEFLNVILLDSPYYDDLLINVAKENPNIAFIYIDHHKREVPKNLPSNLQYYDICARKFSNKCTSSYVYFIGKHLFGEDFKKYSLVAFIGASCDWLVDNELLHDFKEVYRNVYTDEFGNIIYIIIYPIITFLYEDPEKLIKIGELLIENPLKFFSKLNLSHISAGMTSIYKKLLDLEEIYSDNILKVFKGRGSISEVSNLLSILHPSNIIVVFSDVTNSFIEKIFSKKYKLSFRTCRDDIHLGKFVEEFTRQYGITGGGHPKAAGAKIFKRDLNKLIDFFSKKLSKLQ